MVNLWYWMLKVIWLEFGINLAVYEISYPKL